MTAVRARSRRSRRRRSGGLRRAGGPRRRVLGGPARGQPPVRHVPRRPPLRRPGRRPVRRRRAAPPGDVGRPAPAGRGARRSTLDDADRVTRDLLVHELDDAVRTIDLRLAELASDQMEGVHADLLITAGQLNAPEPGHAAMAVERTAGLRDDARPGRRPVPRRPGRRAHPGPHQHRAVDQPGRRLPGLAARRRPVRHAWPAPTGWDGLDAWRARARRDRARRRPARRSPRYRDVLRDELLPRSPGPTTGRAWCTSATGREMYRGADRAAHRPAAHRRGAPRHRPGRGHGVAARRVRRGRRPPVRHRRPGRDLRPPARRPRAALPRRRRDHGPRRRLPRRRHAPPWATGSASCPQAPCVLTPVPDYLAARLARRLLHPAGARRQPARRVPRQPARRRGRGAGPRRRRSRSTRPSPATTCSWPSPPSAPTCPPSSACRGATPRSSRAGPSTPSGWPTRWASTRATSTGSACWPATPGGRAGWWSTPACTPSGWTRQQAIDFMVGQRAR